MTRAQKDWATAEVYLDTAVTMTKSAIDQIDSYPPTDVVDRYLTTVGRATTLLRQARYIAQQERERAAKEST